MSSSYRRASIAPWTWRSSCRSRWFWWWLPSHWSLLVSNLEKVHQFRHLNRQYLTQRQELMPYHLHFRQRLNLGHFEDFDLMIDFETSLMNSNQIKDTPYSLHYDLVDCIDYKLLYFVLVYYFVIAFGHLPNLTLQKMHIW